MVDITLIGAVKRGLERGQDPKSIMDSLAHLGYPKDEIITAIRVANRSQEYDKEIPQVIKPTKKEKLLNNKTIKEFIVFTPLTLILILFIILYFILANVRRGCSIEILSTRKSFLGIELACNQLKVINLEIIIASITIFAIIIILILKRLNKI